MPETPQTDCPFCAIVAGEDDSVELIAESGSWVAFFPSTPATPGHTLLIPRRHVADLWSAEPQLGAELAVAAIGIGRAIQRALEPEGMNLITSKGEAGEQSIFHLHLHLVPRWREDALDIWPKKRVIGREARESLGGEIRAALAG
jgi:diadenosine tetraphosphate (Ap4A) HIT family hydrolase